MHSMGCLVFGPPRGGDPSSDEIKAASERLIAQFEEAKAMGQFRIEIVAVGGHGCKREIGDGEVVEGCGNPGCPDCETRAFVASFRQRNSVEKATFTHWPGTPGEVQDDLLTGKRTGSFNKG